MLNLLILAFSLSFAYIGYLFVRLGTLGGWYWLIGAVGVLMLAVFSFCSLVLAVWLVLRMRRHPGAQLDAPEQPPVARPKPAVPIGGPIWRPAREAQIQALMNGEEAALLYRAFFGADCRLPSDPLALFDFEDALTDADKQLVFTVSLDDVVDHAMATRGYEAHLYTQRIGGDYSFYMLQEDGLYKLMFTERQHTGELFASKALRPVLARYFANCPHWRVPLRGAAELRISPYAR